MKKKTPIAKTAAAPDDPAAQLRLSIARLDFLQKDVAEFEITCKAWAEEAANAVNTSNPRDDEAMRQVSFLRTRADMGPNYLQREKQKLPVAMTALADAVRAFDKWFLDTANSERTALLDEIELLLRPYCRSGEHLTSGVGFEIVDTDGQSLAGKGVRTMQFNAARSVAARCNIFDWIPGSPEQLTSGADPIPDNLTWPELPDVDEPATPRPFDHLGAAATGAALGGPGITPDFERQRIERQQATFERQVRGRAAVLLARYDEWHARGRRFVPENFAELEALTLAETQKMQAVS